MPELKFPRKGSLAYWPRKRARRIYPRLKAYAETKKPKLLGFAGYKAGMISVLALDTNKNSPTFGQEVAIPATVLDVPPLLVVAVRAYRQTPQGLKTLGEAWASKLPKELERKTSAKPNAGSLELLEKNLEKISELRLLVATQPRISGLGKKTPELFEIPIAGKDGKEKFDFAKSLLGKQVSIEEVFSAGEFVDVLAITKGKGYAGPVKRFGVKIQPRKAKGKRRHVGAIGTQVPRKVFWTIPMPGQLGFQARTELNKRILCVETGAKVTPKGGFKHYGIIKGKALVLQGSVPGARKRLVLLRVASRPSKKVPLPEIKEFLL